MSINNIELFLENLEKLQEIIYSGEMYSTDPDYNLSDKIDRTISFLCIGNLKNNFYDTSENFATLYDLLEEYLEARSDYEDNYATFENRNYDYEWYHIYDGYEPEEGPPEIEDLSSTFEELIDETIEEVNDVLNNLKAVDKLTLPEDIKRGVLRKFIV